MSYLVSRRTGEIGIRMALGANRSEVGWRVMREIGILVVAGIVIGLPVAMSGIRLVRNMLYGLKGIRPVQPDRRYRPAALRRIGRRIPAARRASPRRSCRRPS